MSLTPGPDAAVTRAEFVKVLVLTLGLTPSGGATAFTDVGSGDWFAPYVAAAVQAGLVEGTSSTTFSPDATLSREDLAVLPTRALHLASGGRATFTDAGQIDPYATAAVAVGYLDGFADGSFQPLGPTTRAQAAKVLDAVLQREGK